MAQLEDEFRGLAQQILDSYPQAVAQAQLQLGDMFNENEYPSVEQLRRKFKFSLVFEAVPDVGDFRVDIGNQAASEMREQYKQVLADRIGAVKQDLAERLLEPLQPHEQGTGLPRRREAHRVQRHVSVERPIYCRANAHLQLERRCAYHWHTATA